MSETNSSFREEAAGSEKLNPLGRWKSRLARTDVAAIEAAKAAVQKPMKPLADSGIPE